MALNQVGLERLNTATTKKIGKRKNIIINGDFRVAQRGTSSTSNGYQTVDRFLIFYDNTDEAPTQQQISLDSSDTGPYETGFRKAYKITNGNQTGGAGTSDVIVFSTKLEAQDIATSGWNYTSSSSFITLSFWVKSSVAQTFYGQLVTDDGTKQNYPFETGSLTADTWTKVTKTIPGNSNLTFNNDTGEGMEMIFTLFRGTDTTGSVSLNAWAANNNSVRMPNNTSTWYTTNNATFEITGIQLEVGSVATDFEHRSFGEELALCQRYFFNITGDNNQKTGVLGYANSSSNFRGVVYFPNVMRANPTFTGSATAAVIDSNDDSSSFDVNTMSSGAIPQLFQSIVEANPGGMTAGECGQVEFRANSGFMNFSAEL